MAVPSVPRCTRQGGDALTEARAVPTTHGLDARWGYLFAALAAIVSGVSVYVNSFGVRLFADATVYTMLKNGVVGFVLLLLLALSWRRWHVYRALSRRQLVWLIVLAVVGGSVPYVLFFHGLQLTDPVTGALLNHLQFAFVALIAAVFLRESLAPAMWAAVALILVGTTLGTNLGHIHWNLGAWMVLGSTLLFAIDFVITKHLLRDLPTLTVMAAKMTLGSIILVGLVAASGDLAAVGQLTARQWTFVIATGLILLVFTATMFIAIRRIPVTAVVAIGMGAPIITALVDFAASGHLRLPLVNSLGLLATLVAVAGILILGTRRAAQDRHLQRTEP
ncbi:MAG: DMT family transporter [Candidatus Dormiibacterota bacterium]